MMPGMDPRIDIAVKKVVGSEGLLVTQLVGCTLTVLRAQKKRDHARHPRGGRLNPVGRTLETG